MCVCKDVCVRGVVCGGGVGTGWAWAELSSSCLGCPRRRFPRVSATAVGEGPEPRLQASARVSLSQANAWCSNYSPSVQELVEQTEIRLSRVMPALESAQGLDIL